MRGLLIPAALPALLLTPLCADAGVAPLGTVSSCPAIIKNVITAEMLLSDWFVPWDAVDTVDIADMIGSVDTVNVIDTAGAIDTINIVNAIDTINKADTISAVVTDNTVAGDKSNNNINIEVSKKSKRIKFGRRAAFNHSQVTDVLIRVYSHDGDSFSYSEYKNQASFGIGFEVAGVIDWVLSEALTLNFSPGVVFRKPINTAVVGTSEVGVSCPLLLEWGPFGAFGARGGAASDVFEKPWAGGFDLRRLRLFGGIWVGVPLFAWVKWNDEESASFKERKPVDLGAVCGVGMYVSDRAFVDVRGILGLSGYDSMEGHRLNQLAIGVNYVK